MILLSKPSIVLLSHDNSFRQHAVRGGNWWHFLRYCNSSKRLGFGPGEQFRDKQAFRIIMRKEL